MIVLDTIALTPRVVSRCDSCRYHHKVGETWVPCGSTSVKYTDDYRCAQGYNTDTGDCPDDLWEQEDHHRRGYQRAIDEEVD